MAQPEIPTAECFTGVPVRIEGQVCAPRMWPGIWNASWRGVAHADEPLRALVFLSSGGETKWAKSYPSWGGAVVTEIGLPGEGMTNVGASIASYVWPDPGAGTPEETVARVLAADNPGPEIQIPVFEWGWRHFIQVVGGGGATSISREPCRLEAETGRPFRLMTIEGEDPIDVDLLFLPRRQTRIRRCKIWGVKERCRDLVSEPLLRVLDSGRTGMWPVDLRRIQPPRRP